MKDKLKIIKNIPNVHIAIIETNFVNLLVCLQTIFGLSRTKKNTAVIIVIFTLLASIYVLVAANYRFQLSYFDFVSKSALLVIMILVLSIVCKINTDTYFKLHSQFRVIVEQKNDITMLYEEVSAKEELLRQQNVQLITYTEELEKREEKLLKLAYFDTLTGLPNRKMFMEHLDILIEKSKQQTAIFYVVFIDLDSFKKINDTMGHHMGDKFIQFAADNLKKDIHEEDFLGRIGGDEFALMISRDLNEEEALLEIEAMRKSFSKAFNIKNAQARLTASFGISVFPHDGENASEILISADMSMYKAKELGKNNVQFFKTYMQDEIEQIA
jgi:diguanylate cyclase (GGDEF)-like protein